jgi:putative iron-only hydrogenase system regulator
MTDVIAGVQILVSDRVSAHGAINETLSKYGEMIVGRMGIPNLEGDCAVISLVVQGPADALDGLMCDLTAVEAASGFRTVLAKFEE